MKFIFLFLSIYLFFINNLFSEYRFVCSQSKSVQNSLLTNFYVADNKVYMAGSTGNGTYEIIEKNMEGFLAINVSKIGKDYGIESILLNEKNGTFSYKSIISVKDDKKMVVVEGFCKSYK